MKKKRNKKYVPLDPLTVKLRHQPWKVAAVFHPIEAIVDQLEQQHTYDATESGTPVFKDHNDGYWYDTVSALLGVVEAYEIHERRTGRVIDLSPLRQLANKLEVRMPIFASDTQAARACMARMRRETLEMTAGYARQLVKDFQIMEEMGKINQATA